MGRTRTNNVYKKFEILQDGTTKCIVCNKVLKSQYAGNLIKHLKKHQDDYQEVLLLNNTSTPDKNQRKENSVLEECTNLVAIHGRPFAMLNDDAFKNILAMTGCKQTININTVRQNLKDRAANKRLELARELQGKKLLCLKADVASNSCRSYLGLNVQYIENGKIVLRNLAMIELLERHTANYLKEQVLFTLLRYRLDSNYIYSVTTDNGANMLKMTRILSKPPPASITEPDTSNRPRHVTNVNGAFDALLSFNATSDSEEERVAPSTSIDYDSEHENDIDYEMDDNEVGQYNEDIFPELSETFENDEINIVRCAAHTLQLAIQDTYKIREIRDVINSGRNVVRTLRTPNYINKLKSNKKKLPILDCPTRWNSTLDMVERLLLLKDFCDDPLVKLSDEIWLELELIHMSLQPAKKLTILLQKEQLIIGDFYIGWLACKFELKRINNPISTSLDMHMDSRESQLLSSEAFLNAVFLDPRINSTLNNEQKNRVRINLRNLFKRLSLLNGQSIHNIENRPQNIPLIEPNQNNSLNDVQDFLNSSYSQNQDNVLSLLQRDTRGNDLLILDHQIDCFLEEPLMIATGNVLMFWENNKCKFSELYKLAVIVLATPATQVSVERLFSGLKFVLTHLRYNLKSDVIEDILLLRSNSLFQ